MLERSDRERERLVTRIAGYLPPLQEKPPTLEDLKAAQKEQEVKVAEAMRRLKLVKNGDFGGFLDDKGVLFDSVEDAIAYHEQGDVLPVEHRGTNGMTA